MFNLKRGIALFIVALCGIFAFFGTVKAEDALSDIEVKNIDINLTYPKVGTKISLEDPSDEDSLAIPRLNITTTNPHVEVYSEIVTNTNDLKTFTGTIQPGKKYIFLVGFMVDDGYYVNENTLNVTINGKKVTNYVWFDEDGEGGLFVLNYTYDKAVNPMTITVKNKKIKAKKVKKKKQVVAPITVRNAQGAVSYSKVSGSKKIVVNKATGKITVKKKTKKGTYKVKVKVTANGNVSYKAISKVVTVKIKVK